MIIVGLGSTTGYTSGKSTTAQILQGLLEEEGCQVLRISFADPLKTLCSKIIIKMTGQKPGEKDQRLPLLSMSYRDFLVETSRVTKEILGNDVWINALAKTVSREFEGFYPNNAAVIIDDVRYTQEVRWIQSWSKNLLFNVVDETFVSQARTDVGGLLSTDFNAHISNPKTIIGLVRNIQHTALPMILSKLAGPT